MVVAQRLQALQIMGYATPHSVRAITASTLPFNRDQDSLSFDGYSTFYNWHSDI